MLRAKTLHTIRPVGNSIGQRMNQQARSFWCRSRWHNRDNSYWKDVDSKWKKFFEDKAREATASGSDKVVFHWNAHYGPRGASRFGVLVLWITSMWIGSKVIRETERRVNNRIDNLADQKVDSTPSNQPAPSEAVSNQGFNQSEMWGMIKEAIAAERINAQKARRDEMKEVVKEVLKSEGVLDRSKDQQPRLKQLTKEEIADMVRSIVGEEIRRNFDVVSADELVKRLK